MTKAIIRFEANAWATGQDHSGPRDPVCFFPVDQVPEVVERAECLGTFIPTRPDLRDTLEETSKSTRRATQHLDCEVGAELHVVLPGRLRADGQRRAERAPVPRASDASLDLSSAPVLP